MGESAVIPLIIGVLGTSMQIGGHSVRISRKGDRGTLLYGPYERRSAGRYRAEFMMRPTAEPSAVGDPVVATIDVVANHGTVPIAERRLLLSDLPNDFSTHVLEFHLQEEFELEYRVITSGQVEIACVDSVQLTELEDEQSVPAPRGSRERAWEYELEYLDGYLRNISGVIHVGANRGQERRYYWLLGVDVLWVEPIQEMYDLLIPNIARYTRQRAVRALLTDRDGEEYDFNIADEGAGSSSILPFQDHAEIFPDVHYVEQRRLVSKTLDTLLQELDVLPNQYQALTLDVEGAELMVLRGAQQTLQSFDYVKCEVADFPARAGSPTTADLDALLGSAGFRQLIRRVAALGPGGQGTMWDIVWKRERAGEPLNGCGVRLPVVSHPEDVAGLEKSE